MTEISFGFTIQFFAINCSVISDHCTLNLAYVGFAEQRGGGPRVVISTAAFHARIRGSFLGLIGL